MKEKKQSFMIGVATIFVSQLLVKILGLLYRVIITNFEGFGDTGNGFYSAGFQIYTLLLAISSVGIPNAISKLVSEKISIGDVKSAKRIFKVALGLFFTIGISLSILLYIGAGFVADVIIKMPGAKYTLKALAPSILFVSLSSVIRGYFSGMQNMRATSNSQVLEQFFKSTLTILIVYLLAGYPAKIMAAGANFATSIATVLSFCYLIYFYKRNDIKKPYGDLVYHTKNTPALTIAKTILMVSIPISISSVITAINRVLDTMTVMRRLDWAFLHIIPDAAARHDEAVRLTGVLSKVDILTNLPLALNIAFATALVPATAGALAVGDRATASKRVSFSLLITILIVFPCAGGFIALADPILKLLFPAASSGAGLLMVASITLVFTAIAQTVYGSLQGLGKVFVPATSIGIGCIIKLILNILLIPIPKINIYGAAIGSLACQFTACFLSVRVLSKNIKLDFSISKYVIKPAFATFLMSVFARLSNNILIKLNFAPRIATVLAISASVLVYFILVVSLNIFTKEDYSMLPFGHKIYKALQKAKLV